MIISGSSHHTQKEPEIMCLLMEVYTFTYEVCCQEKKSNPNMIKSSDLTASSQEYTGQSYILNATGR